MTINTLLYALAAVLFMVAFGIAALTFWEDRLAQPVPPTPLDSELWKERRVLLSLLARPVPWWRLRARYRIRASRRRLDASQQGRAFVSAWTPYKTFAIGWVGGVVVGVLIGIGVA